MTRIPAITNNTTKAIYWATILSACTMGETAGDFVSFGLKFGYGWASCMLLSLLVIALVLQSRAKTQNEARYWTTIVIMSTTGTAMADLLTRTLKLGYARGSAVLITLFSIIYFIERRRKIDINVKTRGLPTTDAFYWAGILVVSTFGTTMGDFVADVLSLGFGGAALLLGGLLTIVLTIDFRAKESNKLRYWTAVVITSTIGATTGDFLTKPDALNLGYGWGSAILIGVFGIIFLVGRRLKPAAS